jgi:hypothetical protein
VQARVGTDDVLPAHLRFAPLPQLFVDNTLQVALGLVIETALWWRRRRFGWSWAPEVTVEDIYIPAVFNGVLNDVRDEHLSDHLVNRSAIIGVGAELREFPLSYPRIP